MINFIICDDNKLIVEKICNIVSKVMVPTEEEYKINTFTRFDSEFKKIMYSNIGYKIYILDVEVGDTSGLDIARKIRQKDWNSIIIFVSAYYELSYPAFRDRLLILDFISKFDNFEKKLEECITLAMDIMGTKEHLSFLSENTMQKVDYKDILYITRDDKKRKVLIYTDYKVFNVNTTLLEIEKKLNRDFIRTHRACIVNKKNIKSINYTENKITFKNGEYTYLLSRNKKKEVKELCG
jgi:two-component system response regulator AgrA